MFRRRNSEKKIALYQAELLKTHFAEVENMYQKMRGWRHDYRNHIQILKVYTQNKDLDSIHSYLNSLEEDLLTVDTVIKTGNAMADAILNSKISLAKSKNIKVIADANIPVKLQVSEIDLCVIIGNLFDNAIEANLALPEEERLIKIYIDIKGKQLYLSFTNFTAQKKRAKLGKVYSSTKSREHGLGLLRIDDVIEKVDGYLSRNLEDGCFTTEILLPL